MRTAILVRRAALLVALGLGWAAMAGAQPEPSPGFDLTPAERDLARQLADGEISARRLRTDDRLYVVDFELILPKDQNGESGDRRLARVTHYRYDGDLAIVTFVDLGSRQVLQLETIEHPSVPVSQEEFDIARTLVLQDAEVRGQLGTNLTEVVPEALLMNFPDAEDQLFGHRVLRFVFKLGTEYLRQPVAWVDVTARTVTVEPLSQGPETHH